jgi:hypothetical protein
MEVQPHTAFIRPYQETEREQIIQLWERSVRATHHFLNPADRDFYKK